MHGVLCVLLTLTPSICCVMNHAVEMILKHRNRFTNGVVHSFTGSTEEMQKLVELGLYIGMNRVITSCGLLV